MNAHFVETGCMITPNFGTTTLLERLYTPSGGSAGSWLIKASDADLDVTWQMPDYTLLNNKPSIEGIPLVGN
jgi:hypothetical protein